jgi:hypothetical protein
MTLERLARLATYLDVGPDALDHLHVGWVSPKLVQPYVKRPYRSGAYAFPMVDTQRRIIGLQLRRLGKKQWALTGGKWGLFVPANLADLPDPVYVVEGASDTAAAISAGYAAVGRPSAKGGVEIIAELLSDRDVVVLGENDRKPDGAWPGLEGARYVDQRLAKRWSREVTIAMPPEGVKDLRNDLSREYRDRHEDGG